MWFNFQKLNNRQAQLKLFMINRIENSYKKSRNIFILWFLKYKCQRPITDPALSQMRGVEKNCWCIPFGPSSNAAFSWRRSQFFTSAKRGSVGFKLGDNSALQHVVNSGVTKNSVNSMVERRKNTKCWWVNIPKINLKRLSTFNNLTNI